MEESEVSSSFDVSGLPDHLRPLESIFEQAAREIFTDHNVTSYAVSVAFVDDQEISRLNREALKRSGTTDIIAFDLSEDGLPYEKVGDLYISIDTAIRSSSRLGIGLGEEVFRLVVHGILHLAGYTDEEESQRESMKRVQERVVKRFSSRLVC